MKLFEAGANVVLSFNKDGKHHYGLVVWLSIVAVLITAIVCGGDTLLRVAIRFGL